jgi:hypothetical protein
MLQTWYLCFSAGLGHVSQSKIVRSPTQKNRKAISNETGPFSAVNPVATRFLSHPLSRRHTKCTKTTVHRQGRATGHRAATILNLKVVRGFRGENRTVLNFVVPATAHFKVTHSHPRRSCCSSFDPYPGLKLSAWKAPNGSSPVQRRTKTWPGRG